MSIPLLYWVYIPRSNLYISQPSNFLGVTCDHDLTIRILFFHSHLQTGTMNGGKLSESLYQATRDTLKLASQAGCIALSCEKKTRPIRKFKTMFVPAEMSIFLRHRRKLVEIEVG